MKLSRSTGYALVALVNIARNDRYFPVTAKDIAEHHQIPLEYLLKILQQLSRGNVLEGIRGPQGGFQLTRPADKITLGEIIKITEGSSPAEFNLRAKNTDPEFSLRLNRIYRQITQYTAEILQNTTLADLFDDSTVSEQNSS